MKNPKLSVGLPVYNGERFLESTLISILSQEYEDFELIISDNGSEDKTEDICRRYAKEDNRIRYFRFQQNTGAANNYNNTFHMSRGEYFKWAAYDDECHRSHFGRCVEVLENAPDTVVMVYPQAELIDEGGKTIIKGSDRIGSKDPRPHRRLARVLWASSFVDPFFGIIRKKLMRKTQLHGRYFGADNVFLGELSMLGEIWEIDEILFRLREHPKRSVQGNPTARARAAWFDPSLGKKLIVLPEWERMVLEMLKAVWRTELPPEEKLKCFMVVPGVHYWLRFRNAGGRVKNQLKTYFSR